MTIAPKYTEYADDVLSGKIIACRYIKDVCSRYLKWLQRKDIEFRADKADRVVNFVQKLELYEGQWAGNPFILSPFQKFIVYYVYGFYYSGTDRRVIRHAILEVGRKNGKSMFAAALSLYALIADGEQAAQVQIVANSARQSDILFQMVKNIASRMDPKQKYLKPTLKKLKYDKTKSFCEALSSDASRLDGFNSFVFFQDEAHEAKTMDLFAVLATSQAARKNPLSFIITSAGKNPLCPYYQIRQSAIDVIQGRKTNDTTVAFIYTLDDGDDWHSETVWQKSNPNLHISCSIDYLRDQVLQAESSLIDATDVISKNFGVWQQSLIETWITDNQIVKSMQKVNIELFKNSECFVGVDLAAVSDLTCWTVLFPPDAEREIWPDKYVFKSIAYLPEDTIGKSPNSALYRKFISSGELKLTPDNVVDYDIILNDLLSLNESTYIVSVAYDSWNATQFAINATSQGLPMQPFSQSLGNFNRPTKEFERLLLSGKVIIDVSELVRWCFSNVRIKIDHNENCKPDKAQKAQKIDAVISILEALGAYLSRVQGFDVSQLISDVVAQ